MRSPNRNPTAAHRAGRNFEPELRLHYLSPGAFTVLPPENPPPPEPPAAPAPYRLTPTTRHNRNQAFSIIAEPNETGSRSSSPSGRVSPFRGRGFNPTGSRHASPAPSPPPEDARLTPRNLSPRRSNNSRIPTLSRRGSNSAFGEKVSHIASPRKRVLNSQLSQSLSNLEKEAYSNKQNPPSTILKKTFGHSKPPAFQQLSPIAGSSPEPSQSLSSPSRIPQSRSQPGSRITSPTRPSHGAAAKPPISSRNTSRVASRSTSRNPSRNASRNASREPSPTKNPTSPTRISVKNYRNVQAKVNSFKSAKPKVPPKPSTTSDQTDDSDVTKPLPPKRLVKKDSVKKLRTTSNSNILAKTASNNNLAYVNNNTNRNSNESNNNADKINSTIVRHPDNKNKNISAKTNNSSSNNNNVNKSVANNNKISENKKTQLNKSDTDTSEITTHNDKSSADELKKTNTTPKLTDLLPSTTIVVSSTTTTITQPLKIDAKLDSTIKYDKPKPVSPMVDGRVLSATSVSNAMNRMNDSVLNTQTLIKDHGLSSKITAANAIVSMANEIKPTNPALDTKNATTALPTVEPTNTKPIENNHKQVSSVGILDSKTLEKHVQNNMNNVGHVMGNSVKKSVNDRIKEARTVVAADVKPIQISVEGKPSDVEVQSGNVRLPVSATNGLSERPGLPPSNQTPPNEPEAAKPSPKSNPCTRFLAKLPCKSKSASKPVEPKSDQREEDGKTGCFNCRKKKPAMEQVRINIEPNEDDPKPKFMDRLKCCGKNKVGDTTGCFSKGKRKESWTERRDSILSDPPLPKSKCNEFMRKAFCLNLCCKKKISVGEEISRKASLMSSKKKSLTPTTLPPPEEVKPKLDVSLVEYTSHMKGAIPVLPIYLAWFCLVMNCIAPGTGTVFSGLFCLCLGIPRFSQKDGARPRIGALIINLFIGAGQFFTVLFCLVGWGWSIWWGVTMVKISKKFKKLKLLEEMEEQAEIRSEQRAAALNSRGTKDLERLK
ncbi:unnamed protein product [Brassicogethes aeneus]|uniref:Protein stum n=1 Tax=Brassicogethes aeneus TaxID=1431903 RepID=A0A9P0AST8_BRAAE|nr:unnamed protein product [Brassicogethes aeneus]